MDAAERQVEWVKAKRNLAEFAPKDLAAVHEFMRAERDGRQGPLAKHHQQLRQAALERQALQVRARALEPGIGATQ